MKSGELKYKAVTLASQEVGGKTVILNHNTGRIITINQSSAKILSSIRKPLSLQSIIRKLAKEYSNVSDDDVRNLLKNLVSEGVAVISK